MRMDHQANLLFDVADTTNTYYCPFVLPCSLCPFLSLVARDKLRIINLTFKNCRPFFYVMITDCPIGSFFNSTSGQCEYPTISTHPLEPIDKPPYRLDIIFFPPPPYQTNNPEGLQKSYSVEAFDDVDGFAALDRNNILRQ